MRENKAQIWINCPRSHKALHNPCPYPHHYCASKLGKIIPCHRWRHWGRDRDLGEFKIWKSIRWLLVLVFLDQGKYENAASRSETFIKDSVRGESGREEKTCGCVFLWGKNLWYEKVQFNSHVINCLHLFLAWRGNSRFVVRVKSPLISLTYSNSSNKLAPSHNCLRVKFSDCQSGTDIITNNNTWKTMGRTGGL